MWKALVGFQIGAAFDRLPDVLFGKIETEPEHVIEQILRLAMRFAGKFRQTAFVGWGEYRFTAHG